MPACNAECQQPRPAGVTPCQCLQNTPNNTGGAAVRWETAALKAEAEVGPFCYGRMDLIVAEMAADEEFQAAKTYTQPNGAEKDCEFKALETPPTRS